jgi:uncharacterized protein (DUF362 family)
MSSREIDRRTFLLTTGKWLALAGLAGGLGPAISACSRFAPAESSTTAVTQETGPTTAVGAGTTTTSVAASSNTASSNNSSSGTSPSSSASSESATTTASTHPDVAVAKGESVEKNMRAAIALLGGMERFVKKGGTVVVKPNVLTGRPPEYATTTSPELMTAVIKTCWEAGAKEVVVFDNPTSNHRAAFETAGLAQAISAADGKLIYLGNRDYQKYDIPEAKKLTSWEFVTQAFEADTLINLALPKQHGTSGATMTMKNLMGVMGGRRGNIHVDFSTKIVDVNTLIKPTLAILDGYRVLFRNGPTGGSLDDVRLDKTLVAGTNQVSIDAYGTQFFKKKPADFKWLVDANARGLGEIDLGKLNIATVQA